MSEVDWKRAKETSADLAIRTLQSLARSATNESIRFEAAALLLRWTGDIRSE